MKYADETGRVAGAVQVGPTQSQKSEGGTQNDRTLPVADCKTHDQPAPGWRNGR